MTLSVSIDIQSHKTRKETFLSKYCCQNIGKHDSWFLQISLCLPPSVFYAILFVVLVRVQVQQMQHQTDQRKYILLLIDGIYLHLISSEVADGSYN